MLGFWNVRFLGGGFLPTGPSVNKKPSRRSRLVSDDYLRDDYAVGQRREGLLNEGLLNDTNTSLDSVALYDMLGSDDVVIKFNQWKSVRGQQGRVYCDNFTSGSCKNYQVFSLWLKT